MRFATSTTNAQQRRLTCLVISLLAGLCVVLASGCTRLRLPKIDTTGSCLFAPYPENSTELSLGCGCFSCLSGNRSSCLTGIGSSCCLTGGGKCGVGGCFKSLLPDPAFPEPATPPECGVAPNAAANPDVCVEGSGCQECADGPPAVLFGCESEARKLPTTGKRGCILLSPQRIVAPVGGEVLLLSGVCGDDGHLMVREPLEWMLTPDSVGHIIDVGDDDPGILHRLAKTPKADKRSGSFARGVTSTKKMLITRGNKTLQDDVRLEKGQTWISVSSPSEGTSRVTVLAPDSDCWDQRKATATIYWVDARWQFPGPQVLVAGTPTSLTTRVTRSEGSIPAEGWVVRYEILNPEFATFESGTNVSEAVVNSNGDATVNVVPTPGTSGTAGVSMTVIRPAGTSGDMPKMTLGQGQTTITWSAPRLRVRAGAPPVVGYEQSFPIACEVANPGNLDAENVSVSLQLPAGVTVENADSFARIVGNQIIWEIDRIPSQQQWDIQATLKAKSTHLLEFQARADQNLYAEDSVQVDIYRPALSLGIQAVVQPGENVQVGQEVTFNIDVTNSGDRPLSNVNLESVGDNGMMHLQTGNPRAFRTRDEGPLQPGDTWQIATTYVPTTPGQRCLTINATADGEQSASDQTCITVLNPIPATPAMSARIESLPVWQMGNDQVLFRFRILNSGRERLQNVRIVASYDPQLDVLQTTQIGWDGSQLAQYKLNWLIPFIEPGQEQVVEAQFRALQPNPQSLMVVSVTSENGASSSDQYQFEIQPTVSQPARVQPSAPALPPSTPIPEIPSTPIPQTNGLPSGPAPNAAPPIAAAPGALQLRLIALDNPAEVGRPIRFQLVVTNDRDVPDSQVQLSFPLPTGTNIQSISQTMNPGGEQFRTYAGLIQMPELRQMTPRETVTYTIVMTSNQAQQIRFEVTGKSRQAPQGVSVVERVNVLPRQ